MFSSAATRLSVAGLIAFAGLGASLASALADGGITKTYVLGTDGGVVNPLAGAYGCTSADAASLDGACFDVQDGTIDVKVADQSGNKMNVAISYKDAAGKALATEFYCDGGKDIKVPAGGTIAFVNIINGVRPGAPGTPATNPLAPYEAKCGAPALGTTGSITVSGSGLVMDSPAPRSAARTTAPGARSMTATAVPAASAAARMASRAFQLL